MSKRGRYITPEVRYFILRQLAGFETFGNIQALVEKEYQLSVPVHIISGIKYRFANELLEERKKLAEQLNQIPVANLFYRLKERQKLLDDIKEDGLWDKDKLGRNSEPRHLLINKILDSCAEEFKQAINVSIDAEIYNILNLTENDFMKYLEKEKESNLLKGRENEQN